MASPQLLKTEDPGYALGWGGNQPLSSGLPRSWEWRCKIRPSPLSCLLWSLGPEGGASVFGAGLSGSRASFLLGISGEVQY